MEIPIEDSLISIENCFTYDLQLNNSLLFFLDKNMSSYEIPTNALGYHLMMSTRQKQNNNVGTLLLS